MCFRYGDMRKTMGFRIRDMWYNIGEPFCPSGNVAVAIDSVYQGAACDAGGITRQYFLLSSFRKCAAAAVVGGGGY